MLPVAASTALVGGRHCETHRDPSPPGTGTRLYARSVQRLLLPPQEPPWTKHITLASSSQKCMRKGKQPPKNKINPKHLGQRGLPRRPRELAAKPPFPFAFQHSSFVKLPLHCQGKEGGESQRGVSLFTFRQDGRATLKSYRSFFFIC